MKRILLLLVCTFALLTPALQAADFEGTVHMNVTSNKKSTVIDYQIKSGLIRTNVATGKGESAAMIMDTTKATMTILIPGQKMYMVRPIPAVPTPLHDPQKGGDRPIISSGETQTILGYKCTKYTAPSSEGSSVEMWVTAELGNFAGFGGAMGPGASRNGPSQEWAKLVQGQGFFPLLVIVRDSAGTEKTRMEVTSVDKTALPDSTFQPPAGYQELNMGQMMGNGFGRP